MELARRLAERGHHVSMVCFEALPEACHGIEVHKVPLPEKQSGWGLWRFSALRNARHCARGLDQLPLEPVDVVIGGEHMFLKPHHRRFPQTPWLYLAHSLLVDEEIRSYNLPWLMQWVTTRLYVHLQKWALRHADRTFRFTRMACDAMDRRYGLHPRYFINPIGTDLAPARERTGTTLPVRLLWVGQLIPRKRINLALEALGRLSSADWVFDVVGDGCSRLELEEQTRRLGLEKRVRFHGFQKDPSSWYRRADMLLFPSWLENFPVTMVEAMSYGVACLALRGDGVRYHNANAEMMEHGRDGFLAQDDEDFCRQLEALLQQLDRLRAAGDAARETVASKYTWEKHLDRLDELFDDLIEKRTANVMRSRERELC
jgi:glycosyltransferase involved in cell wall biosynthesis